MEVSGSVYRKILMTIRNYFWLVLGLICCYSRPALAYVFPNLGYPKLELNGNYTSSLNVYSISGSSTSYQDDNYGNIKTFSSSSNLFLNGELYRDLFLRATLSSSPFTPNNTRWNLRYDGGTAKVQIGDLNANLAGNEYVLLNRTLKGEQVDAVMKKGTFTVINSQLASPVRSDSFYGRNVSGPYYLTSTPIVQESEQVFINNVRKIRGMDKDYTLDYTNGILDFSSQIIVGPTDNITVSYEVLLNGSGGGALTAIRGSYPVMKDFTVGVSSLVLKGRNVAAATIDQRDQFLGNGMPGPFYLTYRPIKPGSESVSIDKQLQASGTAYTLDYTTGALLFKSGFEPPPNSTVIIHYQTSTPGFSGSDRSITGADVNWQPGKIWAFNLQTAKSEGGTTTSSYTEEVVMLLPGVTTYTLKQSPLSLDTTTIYTSQAHTTKLIYGIDYMLDPTTGVLTLVKSLSLVTIPSLYVTYANTNALKTTAFTLGTNFKTENITGMARYSKVDAGFSPLEMVGFRRVDSSLEWQASYSPLTTLTLTTNGNTTRQPYNPYSTDNTSQIEMEQQDRAYGLQWHPAGFPQFSLLHSTHDSNQLGSQSIGTAATTDTLSLSWIHSAFSAGLNLNRIATDSRSPQGSTNPDTPIPDNPTGSIFHYHGVTMNTSLNFHYQPREQFSLSGNMARNGIDTDNNGVKSQSSGGSVSVNARAQLSKTVTSTASFQTSQTDAAKTLDGADIPAQVNQNLTYGADWRASDTVTIGVTQTHERSNGGAYSNSTSDNTNANIGWQPSLRFSLNIYWFHQILKYQQGSGDSTNNMIGFSSEIHPFGGSTAANDATKIGHAYFNFDAQHIWGETKEGAAQLWQAEGMQHRAVSTSLIPTTLPSFTGNRLTSLSGKFTYPIARLHDLFINGESVMSSGFPSSSTKNTMGIGWNYHITKNLTCTLNAQRAMYTDHATAKNNYQANQLNGQVMLQF